MSTQLQQKESASSVSIKDRLVHSATMLNEIKVHLDCMEDAIYGQTPKVASLEQPESVSPDSLQGLINRNYAYLVDILSSVENLRKGL